MNKTASRQEHKYYISADSARLLCSQLGSLLRTDPHADPNGGYLIRSLYFDSVDYRAFREKIDGIKERSKYRLRFYNFDESFLVFEKKERDGDACRKISEEVSKGTALQLVRGERVDLPGPLLTEYNSLVDKEGLRPAVIVDYYRYAYAWPFSDVRVTLDCDLTTPLWEKDLFDPDLPHYPVYGEGEALLELKFNECVPDFLEGLLAGIPKIKVANSKYTRCMCMLNE